MKRGIALYSLNRGQSTDYLILSALHDTELAIAIILIQFRYGILTSSRSEFLTRSCVGDELKCGSLPGPAKRHPNTVAMGWPTARRKRRPLTNPEGD